LTPDPISGRRPSRAELAAYRGSTVDDLVPDAVRLLFVGINPGLWTAAVGAHFARPGNRFWPAMHRAGLTSRLVDASCGLDPVDRAELLERGIGISNMCPIATARADELSIEQLREGAERLRRLVRRSRPHVVAVLGVTSWRQAMDDRRATMGPADTPFEGARLWILPNPSGLNAHETVETLADRFRVVAVDAGVEPAA
jgi:double-stranded uracil-DNA glycosylase